MPTTYSPEQLTAAHLLQNACHELLAVTADEPGMLAGRPWAEWHEDYNRAYRLHDDAEAEYRHAFPDPATRPEAHEVIAAERLSVVELLRAHVIETVTQLPTNTDGGDLPVVIDCTCGATVSGVMPDHTPSTTGSLQWVMAEHIAHQLLAGHS